MLLDLVFDFCSNYLIELMGAILVVGLGLRYAIYRSSKFEDSYFSSFTKEIENYLAIRSEKNEKAEDFDEFITTMLNSVEEKLPNRKLRSKKTYMNKGPLVERHNARDVVTLREFVSGDKGVLRAFKSESSALKSQFPPEFTDVTDRILDQDDDWQYVLKKFPVQAVNRLIDVLPTIFVVMGIFGTFIGISMALPEIARMDFNNIEGSGEILTSFVLSVTYAMKTSIAGILFSLIMTFLNTLYPVNEIRDKTFKRIANCLENIWFYLHGETSAEKELQRKIPELIEEVKAIRQQLAKEENVYQFKKGA